MAKEDQPIEQPEQAEQTIEQPTEQPVEQPKEAPVEPSNKSKAAKEPYFFPEGLVIEATSLEEAIKLYNQQKGARVTA